MSEQEELSKRIAEAMERSKPLVKAALERGKELTRLSHEDRQVIIGRGFAAWLAEKSEVARGE